MLNRPVLNRPVLNHPVLNHRLLNRRLLDRRVLLLAPLVGASTAYAAPPRHHGGHHTPAAPPPIGSPATTPLGPIDTLAKFAIIADYNTGAVLLNKDGDVPMPPSSMVKLMTAYIVYGMLKSGRLQLDQKLPISSHAVSVPAVKEGGSKMFLNAGDQVSVEDLILGVIVQSGNDACVALAEAIAGSEEGFVELMNAKARELGLKVSTFRNSTGWPDPAQRMSCHDIATLAARLINDFPEYYKYDNVKHFKYNNIDQENRNPLVQRGLADGLKTGHTNEGGFGLVASAQRSGRRVIVVVNGLKTMKERAEESERLLEWSFREYENVTLFSAGDAVENAKVWLGSSATVPLVGGRDLVVTMPRAWRRTAKIAVEYSSPVPAPINQGDQLGRLIVSGEGVPSLEIPLLAGADVTKLGLPGRAIAVVSRFVRGT